MSSVSDAADGFLQEALSIISQKGRKTKLKLYCEGLKVKAEQVDFALRKLKELENRTDGTQTATHSGDPSIELQVLFYCDSFWAFLYSCLDVLAQVENQALKLEHKEKDVGFKKIGNQLNSQSSTPSLQDAYKKCVGSGAFKNLEKYRNCSIHRRHIYFKEESKRESHTRGYNVTATGPDISVERFLCDNPLNITPSTRQKRRIPTYLQRTCETIFGHIAKMLKATKPLQ